MKYKNFLITGIGFILAVFYVLYKRSPTIQQSLITDGYKLVSSSEKKQEIYSNILKRNEKDIDLIVLDPYLISENRRWEALSFWCDLETNKISFLRRLGIYKKFCVMAIDDDAFESGRSYVGNEKKLNQEEKDYFRNYVIKTTPENFLLDWNNWCESERIKPIWKLNAWLAQNVFKYCYT